MLHLKSINAYHNGNENVNFVLPSSLLERIQNKKHNLIRISNNDSKASIALNADEKKKFSQYQGKGAGGWGIREIG